MPEKKTENSPKSARERRFLPEKIFVNFTPEKPKKVPEKNMKNCARESHKVPEKNMARFFLCRDILHKIPTLGTG